MLWHARDTRTLQLRLEDLRLDGVLLRRLYSLCELGSSFGIVLEQVVSHEPLWSLSKPLEEREVLELVCAKNLKYLQWLVVAQVLDEVALRRCELTETAELAELEAHTMFLGTTPTSPAV